MYPSTKNQERVTHYRDHFDKLDIKGFEFPMKIKDIGRFEEKNVDKVGKLKRNVFELVTNDYKKNVEIESYSNS